MSPLLLSACLLLLAGSPAPPSPPAGDGDLPDHRDPELGDPISSRCLNLDTEAWKSPAPGSPRLRRPAPSSPRPRP